MKSMPSAAKFNQNPQTTYINQGAGVKDAIKNSALPKIQNYLPITEVRQMSNTQFRHNNNTSGDVSAYIDNNLAS
jgi:hypothetical protein